MAKKKSRQDELFDRLRAGGLRKRAAKTIARASDKADSKRLRKAVEDLRGVLGELEKRVPGLDGGAAKPQPAKPQPAKPAARRASGSRPATTSSAAAAKRSAAAKKAAATRAANRARAAKEAAASPRPTTVQPPAPSTSDGASEES